MGGILNKWAIQVAFVVYVFPVAVLWAVTLVGIALMTIRELWLGRPKKRRRKPR